MSRLKKCEHLSQYQIQLMNLLVKAETSFLRFLLCIFQPWEIPKKVISFVFFLFFYSYENVTSLFRKKSWQDDISLGLHLTMCINDLKIFVIAVYPNNVLTVWKACNFFETGKNCAAQLTLCRQRCCPKGFKNM